MTSVKRPMTAVKQLKQNNKRRRPMTAIGTNDAHNTKYSTLQNDNSVKDFQDKSYRLK